MSARVPCAESSSFYIITGPNMAGKTTYLRQVALITIMAHMGCYVPAKKASLPVVDRLLTRIGTSDSIEKNSSSFMMEMQARDTCEPHRRRYIPGPQQHVSACRLSLCGGLAHCSCSAFFSGPLI